MRLDVQSSVQEWVDWFMASNQIPAAMMEDALNKTLLSVKEKVVREFMAAISRPEADKQSMTESEEDGGE